MSSELQDNKCKEEQPTKKKGQNYIREHLHILSTLQSAVNMITITPCLKDHGYKSFEASKGLNIIQLSKNKAQHQRLCSTLISKKI